MEQMEKYYRVYAQFKEGINKIDSHRYMTAAQELADTGEDSHIGKMYYRVVDLDWVEAIESTLMYIDKAIREQRRFIEVTEEVVPIEKARNITTESVRHLAQHTNLIARVEGDDVTPERILNIQREESFAIYENRFLYTLLQKLAYFVGLRYKALSDSPNDSFSKIVLHRDFQVFNEKIDYDLSFAVESHTNTKVDLDADVTTLSGYERVLRIRTVLGDFMSTPLMRELTGCEPVRPPILHTNLMSKNPNFKKSLDLWNYIETYTKPGYIASGNEFDGVLEDKYKQALYDTVTLQQFAIELCSNPDLEEKLKADYEEEEQREKAAREKKEADKIKLYEQRAELAVLDERNALRLQVTELGKDIDGLKKEIADLTVDGENKDRKIERITADVKHLEKENADKQQKILSLQMDLDRKEDELQQAQKRIEELEGTVGNLEKEITALKADIAERENIITALEAAVAAHLATIAELNGKITSLEADVAANKAEIAEKAQTISALESSVAEKEARIASLTGEINEKTQQINSLNALVEQKDADIQARDADISAKATQITSLQADVAQRDSTITSLNGTIAEKDNIISENNAKIAQSEATIASNNQKISELGATISQNEKKIADDAALISKKDSEIANKEKSIASLNSDLEKARADHAEELRKLTEKLTKERESAVKKARKEEESKFKKQAAQINSSAKAVIAANQAAANTGAKAKILSVKNEAKLENNMTLPEYREFIKTAFAVKRAQKSAEVGIFIDDYNASLASAAKKYGVNVLPLSDTDGKFERSVKPINALKAFVPFIEKGNELVFIASNEKKTGAASTVRFVSSEAEYPIQVINAEGCYNSSLPYAVGINTLLSGGESVQNISALQLSEITFAGNIAGTVVKNRLKKVAKLKDGDFVPAFANAMSGCNKKFAFMAYSGYNPEQASQFAETLKTQLGFESVVTEPAADSVVGKTSSQFITVYYFN